MVAYILFLLANALLFVRPQEIMPALGDLQLYLACICGALLFSVHDLHNQLRWRTLLQQPVNLCVFGLVLCVVISRASTGRLSGVEGALINMLKVLMYYLVLVSVLTTPQRLRYFLMTTGICATIMIAYSVMDYRSFTAEWLNKPELYEVIELEKNMSPTERKILRHIPDRDGVDVYGNEVWFFRLCGLGIFHDPNDVSLVIMATCIISLYFLTDPKQVGVRYLWLIPLAIMAVAMHYTHSRGGLLSIGVGVLAWLCAQYGGKVAMAIGALGILAVPVALGRAGNIELSGGTGQQRIRLWSDGLQAIQNGRFLFGIGQGQYYELTGYEAHNSFVHAFVEMGFLGGTLFFGCFFLPALTFFMIKRQNFHIDNPELRRMYPFMTALLAGWCMGMCSLSRCYVAPTYMICGACAAFINQVGFYRVEPRPLLVLNNGTIQRWVACSACLLAGAYGFVRVFASWS